MLQVPRYLGLCRGWNGSPFRALGSDGMACIDFFLMENMRFVVNEANTIAGFTDISMYFKAMAAPGGITGSLNDISTVPPLFYAE